MTDEADEATPTSWGTYILVGFMVLFSFAAGALTGVVSDGTAEVLSAFHTKNSACAPTARYTPEPLSTTSKVPDQVSVVATGFPDNNTVQWAAPVAPGTPLFPLLVQNNAPKNDIMVVFSSTDQNPHEIARLWVRAASAARISVPTTQIDATITGYPNDRPYDVQKGVAGGSTRVNTDQDAPPSITVDGAGNLHVSSLTRPAKKGRSSNKKAEYEDLGTDAPEQ